MPSLLLEPTAGQGRSLCAGVDDLEPYLAALDHHPSVGICLDTCHVFAAGAPLDEPGGTTATVDRLLEIAGPGGCGWCTRTTRWTCGARSRTGTRRSGTGHIGLGAFEELSRTPRPTGCPSSSRPPARATPTTPRSAAAEAPRAVSGHPDRRTALLATLALLAMTACWGSTFFLIKDLLDRMPVLDFLAVRFAIASVALCCARAAPLRRLSRESLRHAVVLGLLYGVAQILQTAGLAHTPASVSGFITGMYVVATPLFAALLLRTRITPVMWAAVALALAGLAVLSLSGLSVGIGQAVTFVAALLYALHIVGLGAWSDARQAMGMTVVQLVVITRRVSRGDPPRRDRAAPDPRRLAVRGLHGRVRRGTRAGRRRPGRRPTCPRPARRSS